MHIGILTGGGDVPGLNSCVSAVVQQATERGWRVTGLRRGWAGLVNFDLTRSAESFAAHCLVLTPRMMHGVDRLGGTFLHTSRTDPRRLASAPVFVGDVVRNADETYDCTDHVLAAIGHLGFDIVVAIGGDGTLNFGAHLHGLGVPVVLIPKTMDNDVFGTDYCIGFSTAVTRGVDAITALRTTVSSHERIGVIGLFGRRSGESALITGYLAGVDRILISEVPIDAAQLARLVDADRSNNPEHYAMVVVSEGARLVNDEGPRFDISQEAAARSGDDIGSAITRDLAGRLKIGMVYQRLGYLMRSGSPDALDRMVAQSFGALAVQCIAAGTTGVMTVLRDGNYCTVPADTVTKGKKTVDVPALYDRNSYRAKIAQVIGKPMFLY